MKLLSTTKTKLVIIAIFAINLASQMHTMVLLTKRRQVLRRRVVKHSFGTRSQVLGHATAQANFRKT